MLDRDPFAHPEQLVERVYSYVAYRIGDGPDADDVTSDVVERALRYRESFDPRRGDAVSWMIGIARRCIADASRPSDEPIDPSFDVAEPGDLEEDVLRRLEVRRAIKTLDARDRELIALRFGADLKARDIGPLLDMKTNAVEVALLRVLRTLRDRLERSRAQEAAALRRELGWASQTQL